MHGSLSLLSYLCDLDKQEQKGVGDAQKSLIGRGWRRNSQKWDFFHREGRFSLCNTTVL